MTPDEVRRLIAGGETFVVEFKGEARAPLGDADLVEAVVCLANGDGGTLLVGVEDDGRVTGARPRREAGITDPRRVEALIANRTSPSFGVRCSLVALPEGPVLTIEVPESVTPVGTADGRFLRRALTGRGVPACLPMHFHEMQSRQAGRGVLDYSALEIGGVSWDDLDPLEFERFRRLVRESGGRGDAALVALPDLELAKSLGVIDANHAPRAIRVAGLLLFGREDALRRHLPTHEVAFQDLAGTAVGTNDFFRWPLPRVMEELLARFRARIREDELLVDGVRVRLPTVSPVALREAIANALVHRDYQQLGAVHVQWRRDAVEVGNPGGFPAGVRADNLLVVQPRPRNPLLADALKRAGLAERTGRGVDAIFEEQLRFGRPPPDYSRSDRETVVVELRTGPADERMVELVARQERKGAPLELDDLLVLDALGTRPNARAADLAPVIQRSAADAQARLESLADRGLLEREGKDGFRASRRGGSTREDAEHEAVVLRLAAAPGGVARRDIAVRTGLSSDQAKRLLASLVAAGRLVQHGKGRGVTYRLGAGTDLT